MIPSIPSPKADPDTLLPPRRRPLVGGIMLYEPLLLALVLDDVVRARLRPGTLSFLGFVDFGADRFGFALVVEVLTMADVTVDARFSLSVTKVLESLLFPFSLIWSLSTLVLIKGVGVAGNSDRSKLIASNVSLSRVSDATCAPAVLIADLLPLAPKPNSNAPNDPIVLPVPIRLFLAIELLDRD